MSIKSLGAGIGVLVLLTTGNALAQQSPQTDHTFATGIAQDIIGQVRLGGLAKTKGTSPKVRTFGNMMQSDARESIAQLRVIGYDDAIALPTRLSDSQRDEYDRLAALNGTAFDRALLSYEQTAVQQKMTLDRDELASGVHANLHRFAERDLSMAKQQDHTAGSDFAMLTTSTSPMGKQASTMKSTNSAKDTSMNKAPSATNAAPKSTASGS